MGCLQGQKQTPFFAPLRRHKCAKPFHPGDFGFLNLPIYYCVHVFLSTPASTAAALLMEMQMRTTIIIIHQKEKKKKSVKKKKNFAFLALFVFKNYFCLAFIPAFFFCESLKFSSYLCISLHICFFRVWFLSPSDQFNNLRTYLKQKCYIFRMSWKIQ